MLATQNGRSNHVRISWKRSEKVKVAPVVYVARAPARDHPRNRSLTYSRLTPVTQIILLRLVCPDAMVTEDRGTFKSFAKNSMQASFARPSTGGVVRESLSASPSSPVMAFFFARGWTLTAKVTL